MGKRLPGVQAREMVKGRPVHERVSLQVHRLQWRSEAMLREGFCLLPDEICCSLDDLQVQGEGGEGSPCRAKACPDNVHETWFGGESMQKR